MEARPFYWSGICKQKYRETGGDINDLLDQNVSVGSEDGFGQEQ